MKLAKLGDGPEIFHTIQGEGVSIGAPAVFIRVSGCNLHCVWCDTDYTWNFENTPWPHEKDSIPGYKKFRKADVTIELEAAEIAKQVLAFPCDRAVLTGGEPLLQQDGFLEVIRLVREERPGYQFEVESNATRMPSAAFYEAVNQFNLSPKLSNAGMPETLRLNPTVLTFFAVSKKTWFKFVVAEPRDLEEVLSLCATYQMPRERVLLMPEGRTCADLDRSAAQLAESCRDLGFRFSDRLHIRLWGDQRGV